MNWVVSSSTNNSKLENTVEEMIPFIMRRKKEKHLRIYFTITVQVLYEKKKNFIPTLKNFNNI